MIVGPATPESDAPSVFFLGMPRNSVSGPEKKGRFGYPKPRSLPVSPNSAGGSKRCCAKISWKPRIEMENRIFFDPEHPPIVLAPIHRSQTGKMS